MLTLKRPRPARNRYRKKEKQPMPQLRHLSDLHQQERRFRRSLEWGALGVSFFIILVMFYLFDGMTWLRDIA
ncbi:hypothetical protein [Pontibacter indicus]|uniref:Uncharacterized protein n=1 Tax=Pontibacter indicus TaxID=1317125 RepID=A0A1R3XTL9_9BACT|nr:hypothetical protein [Pontibacter indicus]SIT95236.1 hypothetical protein SAMN05444128_3978 [Pontibacter indicus]